MKLYLSVAAILLLGLAIYIAITTYAPGLEPFVDTYPIPDTGVPYGYYQADTGKMAKIPHGYELDVNDPTKTKIIPITNVTFFVNKPIPMPSTGLPDGFYQVSSGFMAHLPPGMKAKLASVDADSRTAYDNGYITESEYYKLKFPQPEKEDRYVLPKGFYLNDDQTTVSPLPYGKIAKVDDDGTISSGFIDNPNLISSNGVFDFSKKYSDIANKMDTKFHEDEDDVRAKQKSFEKPKGGIMVLDESGKNFVVLPRESVQGDLNYNEPASFKYGQRTYVPNYEDSVFLSRTTMLPTTTPFRPAKMARGFCESLRDEPDKIEYNCNRLDPNACAATSCCVLLGGTKCVRGDQRGPGKKSHYSDVFLRNKDFYYYRGKCFGNCVEDTKRTQSYDESMLEDGEEDAEEFTDETEEHIPEEREPEKRDDMPTSGFGTQSKTEDERPSRNSSAPSAEPTGIEDDGTNLDWEEYTPSSAPA